MRTPQAFREQVDALMGRGRRGGCETHVSGAARFETLLQDIHFATRIFRKNPGFTLVAILTLALGIGANTAIFTLIDAVMLRHLNVKQPGQLVELFHVHPNGDKIPLSFPMFQELTRRQQAFTGVFGWSYNAAMHNVQVGESLSLNDVIAVTGNFYSELGASPALGRLISPADANPDDGSPSQVAVIAYGYWQRIFGGEPDAIGKQIVIEGQPFTIIGVTQKNFSAMDSVAGPDITVPITSISELSSGRETLTDGGMAWVYTAGRLRDGLTMAQARAQVSTFWPQLLAATAPANYTGDRRQRFLNSHVELASAAAGEENMMSMFYSEQLLVLIGMVSVLLLATCLNLANLMLARAAARSYEMSVRAAVGATQWRLVRQLATESLLLSVVGALLALGLAHWASTALLRFITRDYVVPVTLNLSPDLRVLGLTSLAAILAGLLCAVAPAWLAARQDPADALKGSAVGFGGAAGKGVRALIVAQVALSVVLLLGAGPLQRSLEKMFSADPGFQRGSLVLFDLEERPGGYKNLDSAAYHREMIQEISAIPGVNGAGWSNVRPGEWYGGKDSVSAVGGQSTRTLSNVMDGAAAPGFFDAVGVELVRGRDFAWTDDEHAPGVAIINSKLASKLFPTGDAVGRHIHRVSSNYLTEHSDVEVIGVVNDGRLLDVRNPQGPGIYLSALQFPMSQIGSGDLVVRATANREDVVAAIRGDVQALRHEYVFNARTDDDLLGRLLLPERITSILAGCFAGIALALSLIGLYGVMSYAVQRRTRELGIRMALGAQRGEILRAVLREALLLTLAGIAIGLPCAFAATRVIQSMLYGLSRADSLTIVMVIATLVAVGIVAGYVPARRAMRVDPMVALRHE
jgi:predicted permease